MKCPECGFECLPDDVECLACGTHIAAAIENKEKERIRSIEAAQRKAQYDLEFKKELGLIPDDDKKGAPKEGASTLEETFKQQAVCPKCGHPRNEAVGECLRCGVIFDRLTATSNGGRIPPEPSAPPPPTAAPSSPPPMTAAGPEDKTSEIDLSLLKPLAPDEPANPMPVNDAGQAAEGGSVGDHVEPTPSTESVATDIQQAVTGSDDGNGDDDDLSNLTLERGPAPVGHEEPVRPLPPAVPPVQPTEPAPEPSDEKTEIIQIRKSGPRKRTPARPKPEGPKLGETIGSAWEKTQELSVTAFSVGWAQFLRLTADKKKTAKVLIALSVIVVLAVATPMGLSFYKTMKIERLKREHAQKLETIRNDFIAHQQEISNKINLMISNNRFDSAEKEIALYDIPLLQNELTPLKNHLTEMRLFEKARMIPAVEFEKNYLAFAELLELNPSSALYKTKKEFYKQKLAASEFSLAESYAKGANKNLTDLNKAVDAIERALALYPTSKTYLSLKRSLLTEKLLYYEGNDKLVMAVQDDGMGKKLYSGQRRLTIRLKNISQETVYINVQFFTMIGTDKTRYTYNDIGRRFKTKLLPGETTQGELYFRTKARPAKVIFSHLIAGEISREFPD